MRAWLERRVPEVVRTFGRFPLAIGLDVLAVVVLIWSMNEWPGYSMDLWRNVFFSLAGGAIAAVGGQIFRESRPDARIAGIVLAYILPLVVAALGFVPDMALVFQFPLIGAAILWVSVAGFTRIGRGGERAANQDRFWWLNYRGILAACIGIGAFILIFMGVAAIERALSLLLSLEVSNVIYRGLLPVIGGLLVPIYWLSTLPRLSDFDPQKLSEPDFLARAIGFIGEFIVAPLLVIYGVILLIYTGLIVATQKLPDGVIGWMFIGFVIVGAANWLVLYPPFMRDRPVVKFFRRWWFWLTLVPLGLFAVAIFTRIDAYGLTGERIIVIAAGIWAAVLTLVFLLRRGDIRLIPAVAGVLLVLLSVGPFNMFALPVADQAARLDRALTAAGPDLNWPEDQVSLAREAIWYLYNNEGKPALDRVLAAHNIDPRNVSGYYDPSMAYVTLKIPQYGNNDVYTSLYGYRGLASPPIDVAATPNLIGDVVIYREYGYAQLGFDLRIVDNQLVATLSGKEVGRSDVAAWVAKQRNDVVTDPTLDIVVDGRRYRMIVGTYQMDVTRTGDEEHRILQQLNGSMFTDSSAPLTEQPAPEAPTAGD